MGCGSSKGGMKHNKLQFKRTGLHNLDRLLDECEDLQKAFTEIVTTLDEKKEQLFLASDFILVPCASKFNRFITSTYSS